MPVKTSKDTTNETKTRTRTKKTKTETVSEPSTESVSLTPTETVSKTLSKTVSLTPDTKLSTTLEPSTASSSGTLSLTELTGSSQSTGSSGPTGPTGPRAGRTLLVKPLSGASINSSTFNSLSGLLNKVETKSSGSYFLTFNNIENATLAFNKLSGNSTFNVKYSYYRVFFTINGLTDTSDYTLVKNDFIKLVEQQTNSNVLYCKLYRKDNKFIGCGDFTIDTLDGMNALLNKEGGTKNYSFGSFNGSFYRYNNDGRKDKPLHSH